MYDEAETGQQADGLLPADMPLPASSDSSSFAPTPFFATYPPDSRSPFAPTHVRPSLPPLWTTVPLPGPSSAHAHPATPSTPGFPGPLDVPWTGTGAPHLIDNRFNAQRCHDFHVKMSELGAEGRQSGDTMIQQHCEWVEQSTGERSRVLDVGCGTGAWAYARGQGGMYCDVLGIDHDLSMIGYNTAQSSYDNVIFEAIDFTQPPPYSSYVFDVVHFRNLAWRASNYHLIIERYARLLKPGGLMVVTELELVFRPMHGAVADCLSSWHKAVEAALSAQSIRAVWSIQHLRNMLLNTGLFETKMLAEEMILACGGAVVETGRFDNDMVYYGCKVLEPALLQYSYGKADIERLILDCYNEIARHPNKYYQKVNSIIATKTQY